MEQTLEATVKKVTETFSRLTSGVILLQANPSQDGLAAATSLYLALSKLGKHVALACSGTPKGDYMGMDKIQNTLASGGNHLVISFPYTEGAIDKVDYSIAGDSFNLIIVPNSETSRINPKDVKFSYTGGKIEFIVTIDAPNLNSLGQLYAENQGEFQGKTIVNIDRHLINNSFGGINLVNKQASSTSELVLAVLRDVNVEMDKDLATNLYAGIVAATNNFSSYSVNPMTFEAAAFLMKHGAVKKQTQQQPPQQKASGFAPFGFGGGAGAPGGQQERQNQGMNQQPQMPRQQPAPQPPMQRYSAPPTPQPMAPHPLQTEPMPMQDPTPFPFMGGQPRHQTQNQPLHQAQGSDMIPDEPMPLPDDGGRQPYTDNTQTSPQQQHTQNNHQGNSPQQGQSGQQSGQKNPQDWLKPKLFRGGNVM